MPHWHGDHDVKFGGQYQFTNAWNTNQGNMNGTYSFGRSNVAFNAADPLDVSGPLLDPRWWSQIFTERSHYLAFFGKTSGG